MVQTDIEDFIDEHNLAHGLPSARRNQPCPQCASNDLPAALKRKLPRRLRQPHTVQTDLEDFIAADKAAEARKAAAESISARTVEAAPLSATKASSTTEQPEQDNAEAEDIKFFEEGVHIRKKKTRRPTSGDRSLLRPVQEMLAPLRQRKKGRGNKGVEGEEEERRLAVCVCGHARGKNVDVYLLDRPNGKQRASVTGIYRCGNGEVCPWCARIVADLRAKRYRVVHEAVNALGGTMLTFVFTIDHKPEDELAPLLADLKSASTGVRSDRFWNEQIAPILQAVGAMVDVHVRWSFSGGWHPHLHVTIACLTGDREALQTGAALLIKRYVERLAKLGRRASKELQSMTILDARPNAYPAHHHRRAQVEGKLADEMDETTSLSPFDIAELAAAGDVEMKARFVEFAKAMHGSKSGVITARMAQKLGIEPGTDPGPGFDKTTRVGAIPSPVWMKLLDLNLTDTFLTHVETFGRAGWQRSRWWALQQTGFVPPILEKQANEIVHLLVAADRFEDPEFKRMARDMIGWLRDDMTHKQRPETVDNTMAYAEAHWRHATVDEGRLQALMENVATWADKRIMSRWRGLSDITINRRYRSSREAVPVG